MNKEWVLNIIISLTANFLVWIHHIRWALRFHKKQIPRLRFAFRKFTGDWPQQSHKLGSEQAEEGWAERGCELGYSCNSSLAEPRGCHGARRPFRGVSNMEVRNQVFVSSHRSVIGSKLPFVQTSFLAKGISWEGLLVSLSKGTLCSCGHECLHLERGI